MKYVQVHTRKKGNQIILFIFLKIKISVLFSTF